MRRAQGAAGLVIAFGIIALVIIMMFFFSIIQNSAREEEAELIENKVDNLVTLINLLRTPVGSENIAELIITYHYTKDSNTENILKTNIKQVLDITYADSEYNWKLNIDGNTFAEHPRCDDTVSSSDQELLLLDGNKIIVELISCD